MVNWLVNHPYIGNNDPRGVGQAPVNHGESNFTIVQRSLMCSPSFTMVYHALPLSTMIYHCFYSTMIYSTRTIDLAGLVSSLDDERSLAVAGQIWWSARWHGGTKGRWMNWSEGAETETAHLFHYMALFISSMFIIFRTKIFGAASLLDVFGDGSFQLSTFYATVAGWCCGLLWAMKWSMTWP